MIQQINRPVCSGILALILSLAVFTPICFSQAQSSLLKAKKRDPFVALVNSNGKIKSVEELFPAAEERPLSVNVVVSAIIWDEKRPLAFVNGKVYSEGAKIASDVFIEKIYPRSIVVNDSGNLATVKIKKN